jgi:hypothetical protein
VIWNEILDRGVGSLERVEEALGPGVPPLPLWAHGEPAATPALLFGDPDSGSDIEADSGFDPALYS